jgi:hypothetical protein
MRRLALAICCALAVALAARAAVAASCVILDPNRDNLAESDRAAVVTLLGQALAQQGVDVSPQNQNCLATYLVYHVRLGNSVTVYLQGPQGYRQATARTIEDLPSLYSQMVRSLLTGQPMDATNGTVDRNNVTSAQQAPRRAEADSLWYARLGYAAIAGPTFNEGPDIGFGYRYELDSIGIDLSFNLVVATNRGSAGTGSVGGSFIKLEALYFLDPTANASFYVGGGASWGGTVVASDTEAFSGSGLQGELTAGYEVLRASTIRLFLQLDGTLPLYAVSQDNLAFGAPANRSYAPTFGLSFGLGWGRSVTRVHVVP